MSNLYELLGIKSSATVKAIRAAYHKKAKKAHPDAGGTAEEFAALKKAHDILMAPDRRARYDANGDESEATVDNSLSQVIGLLATSLDNVLRAIENRMGNPLEFEIVNDMKILLGGSLDEIQRKRKEIEGHRAKSERLLGRFGVKEGENYLEGIIANRLSALDIALRQCDEQEKPIKKALDILANSSFRSDFGGEKKDHAYGKTAYNLQVLMNKAMHGAFTA